jgi:hypothetical protein
MARTIRKTNPHPWRKENKAARKATVRKLRSETRRALATGTEPRPVATRTCGWITH